MSAADEVPRSQRKCAMRDVSAVPLWGQNPPQERTGVQEHRVSTPSLQDGIDRAGSAVKLLWRTGAEPWMPPVVQPEYSGWRQEQASWGSSVALMDLSYHMWDTFVAGSDATRLLSEVSANSVDSCAVGQAKQFVAVTKAGLLVGDGILLRREPDQYVLTGRPTAQMWLTYHAERGGYDVDLSSDPDCWRDRTHVPVFFRYQVQGPRALEVVEAAFGRIPEAAFFHTTLMTWQGRTFRALRHGMAGQPGFEFIGDYSDHQAVKEVLLQAGEPMGLQRIGALAYPTAQAESGWVPAPQPAIYTEPGLVGYRSWLSLFTPDGQQPLHGSYYSEDIEDYYVSPYELGYGRSISLNHDFIGRDALAMAKDQRLRVKVTLVADPDDVRQVLGADHGIVFNTARHRVEVGDRMIGMTQFCAYNDPIGTVLGLALLEHDQAATGTAVTVAWGDHPGPTAPPGSIVDLPRVRATVHPAPYTEYARSGYRAD